MTPADILKYGRRYLTVGALCALIHNLIMIGGDFFGVHYLPATLISFAVVTPLGYFLHCRFTFRKAHSLEGFLRFMAGIAIGYPISLALMVLFCSGLGLPVLIAAPLATAVLFVFNYLSAHWAIVRRLRQH
ncbi:MAG: GtrA family protein [Pseudomonadota bacterium]